MGPSAGPSDGASNGTPTGTPDPIAVPVETRPERAAARPDLRELLLEHQVRGEEKAVFDGPLWFDVRVTRTEVELLERLWAVDGDEGLLRLHAIAQEAIERSLDAYPPPEELRAKGLEKTLNLYLNDGHADAYRHVYGSARLAQEFGTDFAVSYTTAHEGGADNEPHREAMDVFNNALGLAIVAAHPKATREELDEEVRRRLFSGEALVQDADGAIEWSDRVAVGEHGHEPGHSTLRGLGLSTVVEPRVPPPWEPPAEGTLPAPDPLDWGDVLFRTENVDVSSSRGLRDYVDPLELVDYALPGTEGPRFALAPFGGGDDLLGDGGVAGIAFGGGTADSAFGHVEAPRFGFVEHGIELEPVEPPFSERFRSPRVPPLLLGAGGEAWSREAGAAQDGAQEAFGKDSRGDAALAPDGLAPGPA